MNQSIVLKLGVLAAVTAVFMPPAMSRAADPVVLFNEDFESPDVTGYSQGTTPSGWVRHAGVFGADKHGLIDKDSGHFTGSATNDQAYALRYTSSPGITSADGQIEALKAGVPYTVTFQVQQDLGSTNGSGAEGDYYDAKFVAYPPGANRALSTGIDTGTLLDSAFGAVATDGQFHTITMTFTADPVTHAAIIGLDLAVYFSDVWAGGNSRSSGVLDNVRVTRPPGGSVFVFR